jgi:hypothetical protein
MNKNLKLTGLFAGLLVLAIGCNPCIEQGSDLPGPPTVEAVWFYLDSNTVVVEADASEDVFLHFWDFGNGKTSNAPVDTAIYYVEGTYGIQYQGHAVGGMALFQDSVLIEKTLELPCEGTMALLTGCENPKAWKFAQDAGAIAIGPEPGSDEWYSSPEGALVEWQYDDRWTLNEEGAFIYENNGGSMNPFKGYIETLMTVQPSTYMLELESGPNGEDQFTVSPLTTEITEICGWMGVWDSGPTYIIAELTENRLVVNGLQQSGDCVSSGGYFTLIFDAE